MNLKKIIYESTYYRNLQFLDNEYFAYTSNKNGINELYVTNIYSKLTHNISIDVGEIENFITIPKSRKILITVINDDKLSYDMYDFDKSTHNELLIGVKEDHEPISIDGKYMYHALSGGFGGLYQSSIETGKSRCIFESESCMFMGSSPNGRYIVVWDIYKNNTQQIVVIDSSDNNISHMVYTAFEEGSFKPYAFWKDNDGFFFVSDEGVDIYGLKYYNVMSDIVESKYVTTHEVIMARMLSCGKTLMLLLKIDGYSRFAFLDLKNDVLNIPNLTFKSIFFDFMLSPDGEHVVFTHSHVTSFENVCVYNIQLTQQKQGVWYWWVFLLM